MFTSGTATDWIDLADKLRLWLTGTVGWTQLKWVAGDVNTGGMELSLRGPGAGVDKQVFINIRSVHDDTVPMYAWEFRGAVDYSATQSWGTQVGESTATFFSLWKNAINYWFYGNDRRFIVIAQVNTLYLSMHAGFFLPWATPEEYPFPLFIGGSDGVQRVYDSTNSAHRFFVCPGGLDTEGSYGDYGGGKIRLPDGNWKRIMASVSGSVNDYNAIGGNIHAQHPTMWPYSVRGGSYSSTPIVYWNQLASTGGTSDQGCINKLTPTAQGERLMVPVLIMQTARPGGYGALDGVYFPMAGGLTPEQTAVMGARTFRFFNNVHRISGNDWMAIEEV